MRKIFIIIVAVMALPAVSLAASGSGSGNSSSKFSLAAGSGPTRTGYASRDGAAGTFFWNCSAAPDWRFSNHWGLILDIAAGEAFAGTGTEGDNTTLQAEIFAGPYYEWEFTGWYIDALAGAFARYRQPYYAGLPGRLGPSASVGPSTGVRAGIVISTLIDVYGTLRLERSLYDPLAATGSKYMENRLAGNIILGFGVRFNLSR